MMSEVFIFLNNECGAQKKNPKYNVPICIEIEADQINDEKIILILTSKIQE